MTSHSKGEWRESTLDPIIKRRPERKEEFRTESGIGQDTVYCPQDVESSGFEYHSDLGYPGEYPYQGSPAQHVPGPDMDHATVFGIRNS